ncbi:general secretion pathway protein GspK [Lysobacter sp. D1-1-M9]|uniref:general secretion pathway protein GspK n=1 Tax=Novilysobacter longmucuonensis TaxID=3098603 RepID=UPI002FC5C3DE
MSGARVHGAACAGAAAEAQRGAALLLVLWLITLLTALVGGFALSARIEALQGRVLVSGVVASGAARAGVEYALTRVALEDPQWQWQPDGRPHLWEYGGAKVEVTLVDESGKVDLNQGAAPLLSGLLRAVGAEQAVAERLAGAIVDWRDLDPLTQPGGGAEDADYASAGLPYGAKDAPFESIAELELVLGFTPELYALVEPHVTVYSGRGQPDPAFAPAEVLDAMGMDGAAVVEQRMRVDPVTGLPGVPGAGGLPIEALMGSRSGTYSIESRARLTNGRESVLRVVVRAGGSAVPGMAYTALRWEEGASPR